MNIKEIKVKDYLTKSNLPASDYVINPYVGCTHACKYCYASFMKRFTGHKEEWGTFIDIKRCDKEIDLKKLKGKTVFMSSVTDCYNQFEEKYQLTRKILEQLIKAKAKINISTKSKLVLRDIDLLKQIENITVSMSINTLNESFRKDMDKASTIQERLDTLKELHENGIYTILFISPIFPYITDYKKIVELSKEYIDEYWFENLNLRGEYKTKILAYMQEKYSDIIDKYTEIYIKGNKQYWIELSNEIEKYCKENNVKYKNYFYHEKLVEEKKQRLVNKK
jgi:DNA repair photolyase